MYLPTKEAPIETNFTPEELKAIFDAVREKAARGDTSSDEARKLTHLASKVHRVWGVAIVNGFSSTVSER